MWSFSKRVSATCWSCLGGVREWVERIGRKHERGDNCNFGGGCGLGGLILTSNRGLRQDIARLETRLDERINGLESRFDAMEKQFGELRERMSS